MRLSLALLALLIGPGGARAAQEPVRPPATGTFHSRLAQDQPHPEAFEVRISVTGMDLDDAPRKEALLPERHWGGSLGSGSRTVEGLPTGVPLRVELVCAGKVWRTLSPPLLLEPGERVEQRWDLELPAVLRGRVCDPAGEPLAGAFLWLLRSPLDDPEESGVLFLPEMRDDVFATTRTDTDGTYRVTDLPAGKWLVGPAARKTSSLDPCPLARFVRTEGGQEAEWNLTAAPGVTIEGRVLDPGGRPVAAWVQATSEDPAALVGVRAGDDGRFVLGPLPPGRFSLEASERPHAASAPLEIAAGAAGVELRLRPGGSLEGMITGRSSSPSGAGGWLRLFSAGEPLSASSWSGANGPFRLEGLTPGVYDLVASSEDGWVGVAQGIDVGPGARVQSLELELRPAARIRMRYAGVRPQVWVTVLRGDTVVVTASLRPADSTLEVVPDGPLRIELRYREERAEREVEAVAGETVEVLFD